MSAGRKISLTTCCVSDPYCCIISGSPQSSCTSDRSHTYKRSSANSSRSVAGVETLQVSVVINSGVTLKPLSPQCGGAKALVPEAHAIGEHR